jgi:drug/metabolite transporter (DMT)-like permease
MDASHHRPRGRRILGIGAMAAGLMVIGGCESSGHDGSCRGACDEPLAVVAATAAAVGFLAGLVLLSDDCGGYVSHSGSYCSPSSPATNYDLVRSWKCER